MLTGRRETFPREPQGRGVTFTGEPEVLADREETFPGELTRGSHNTLPTVQCPVQTVTLPNTNLWRSPTVNHVHFSATPVQVVTPAASVQPTWTNPSGESRFASVQSTHQPTLSTTYARHPAMTLAPMNHATMPVPEYNGGGHTNQDPPRTPPALMPFPLSQMPIMGQLPTIPKFTGEGRAIGESFKEWHEHFENVAKLTGWNDQWKLVHLTSCLQDTAIAFYLSCGADVRNNYTALVTAMQRRFTPLRLTAVQAQLFRNRQQQEREKVDLFAQELQNAI